MNWYDPLEIDPYVDRRFQGVMNEQEIREDERKKVLEEQEKQRRWDEAHGVHCSMCGRLTTLWYNGFWECTHPGCGHKM